MKMGVNSGHISLDEQRDFGLAGTSLRLFGGCLVDCLQNVFFSLGH